MHPQNKFHRNEDSTLISMSRKLCNWTWPCRQILKTKSQRIWTPRQAHSPNEPFASWPPRLRPTCFHPWIQKNQVSTSSAVSEASKYFALHILWISSRSVCRIDGLPSSTPVELLLQNHAGRDLIHRNPNLGAVLYNPSMLWPSCIPIHRCWYHPAQQTHTSIF